MRSFTRVCRIYVTVLHYISEGAIALFYYTNLHLMVIFNTYKCADWRKFLIFTDITKKKKKKPREVPTAWMHVVPWTLSVKPKRSWTFVQWVTSISSLCLHRFISSVNRLMDTRLFLLISGSSSSAGNTYKSCQIFLPLSHIPVSFHLSHV